MKRSFPLLQVLGFLLLAAGIGCLLLQRFQIPKMIQKNLEISSQIQSLLPEPHPGIPADYSDSEMPVLQISGEDYVCLLEVPAFGICLPVQNQWENPNLATGPCRYWGSIYDGTLILGGSNQDNALSFCTRLDIGDEILLTDMQGTQFRCTVEKIQRSSSAEFETLSSEEYPLTLFLRESFDERYILIRCGWAY